MLTPFAENLWVLRYPLKLLGADLRRNVTVIRLSSGELMIHSTAPFSPEDVAAIHGLGQPAWLVDAMLHHDTFAGEGLAAFPGVPYLTPPGFVPPNGIEPLAILPPPLEWNDEVSALEIQGMPTFREHVFLHHASRTLVVADLVFNFDAHEPWWTELLLKAAVSSDHHPGMSRPFRAGVKDEAAFRSSMDQLLGWDFDRVVVGHGDVIETGGKEKITRMLALAGF